jgi:hypothetical protein
MKKLLVVVLVCASLLLLGSCAQVKPWEKETLSLESMSIDDCPVHRFERNVEVYREGAMGGNGGKSGGGCGCS